MYKRSLSILVLVLVGLLGMSIYLNKLQYQQNKEIESQLRQLRQSYIEHLGKCSFISRDMIQKINGRHVLLYHAQNVYH